MSFDERLKGCRRSVEARLDAALTDLPDSELAKAMRYAVSGGGKCLRGFLVLEGAAMHDVAEADALHAAHRNRSNPCL